MVRGRLGRRLLGPGFTLFHLRRVSHAGAFSIKAWFVLATPLLIGGCSGELSALDPAGPRAANLALLWWIMFGGSALLFVLVMVLFGVVYLRPGALARLDRRVWIIGGGLVLPIPILVLLTGASLVLGEQLLPKGEAPYRVEAVAERWQWRFRYPQSPGAPELAALHIPAGAPVDIVVTSEDVIHSFWVPRLGGKMDAIPGHTNVIRLEADKPGTYWGVCAEFCGVGHDSMPFRVDAHQPEALDQAIAEAAR